MNRSEWKQYISRRTTPCPTGRGRAYPNHEVFRHPGNRKWFALMMDVLVQSSVCRSGECSTFQPRATRC